MGSGKNKHTDIHSHKKDIRRPAKGKVGRGIAESSMESQHFYLQSDKIYPF
jgi:hypothetical protein